jgi:histidinol-phosphate aminotransferase
MPRGRADHRTRVALFEFEVTPPVDYNKLVRPQVASMKPYTPGTTVSQARKKYGLEKFVKLSSNENPLGTSPKAAAALRDMGDLQIYVDDDHAELRRRLAEPYGLAVEHVLVGHGSNDVVRTLFSAYLAAGDEVVLADPTFSLFPKDAILFGAVPVRVPLRDGVHDLDAMLAAITPRTKIVVVVDPNNPTSTRVERDAFERFARALPAEVILIVDQAYREYMPTGSVEGTDWVKSRPATIVLRTHSKLFGLASLRFGYALGDPELLAFAQRVRLPFNVSRPAEVAALAALDDHDFVRRSLETNELGKAFLYPAFAKLGLHAYPTAANFVAVAVPGTATEAYEAMLQRGIVTRSGDALGMPGRLRITIGTPEQNALLIEALGSLVAAAA